MENKLWNIGMLSIILSATFFIISMLFDNVFESDLWNYFMYLAVGQLLISGILIIWLSFKNVK